MYNVFYTFCKCHVFLYFSFQTQKPNLIHSFQKGDFPHRPQMFTRINQYIMAIDDFCLPRAYTSSQDRENHNLHYKYEFIYLFRST